MYSGVGRQAISPPNSNVMAVLRRRLTALRRCDLTCSEQILDAREDGRPAVFAFDIAQTLTSHRRPLDRMRQSDMQALPRTRAADRNASPPLARRTWPSSTLHRPLTSAGTPWFQASSSAMLRLSYGDGTISARARASSASRNSSDT